MIGHYLLLALLYPIAYLPSWILYRLSDVICFFLSAVMGYRKRVITENLKASYPDLNNRDIARIRRGVYRNISDIIVETIMQLSFGRARLERHCHVTNPELIQQYATQGRSVLYVLGHYGNWEWLAVSMANVSDHRHTAVYKIIATEAVDRLFQTVRRRLGQDLVAMRNTIRHVMDNRESLTSTLFAGDQTPLKSESQFWMDFMGREAPIFLGVEKIARKTGFPVIYLEMERVRRGRYEITAHVVSDDPASTEEFEITRQHTRLLEQTIRKDPANWLWSHRRWKHTKGS